ncbi:DNA internalization-related competence protein ComEC/Rec2 [Leptothrix ochracea]|uniref:DNA internalization-related competence protein ComEC/Rec2 n=1 Tax=Leptothrix ochracea TaxID=735331 RepID=UPI0034E21B8B
MHAWILGAALVAGTALQLQQATLWALHWAQGAVVLGGISLMVAWWLRASRWRFMAVLVAGVLLGWGQTAWRADERLAQGALAPAWIGRDIEITGVVASLPVWRSDGVRFVFEVESANVPTQDIPKMLSLGWWRGWHEGDLNALHASGVRVGERWQLQVRLKPLRGAFNPHGFDVELWGFEQGLRVQGSVRASGSAKAPIKLAEGVGYPVERLRQHVRDRIEATLGPERDATAGVISALVVGDQAAIEREDWRIFRLTGVAHLMSISGLHITMLAGLGGALIRWFWCRSERLVLLWPAAKAMALGGVLVAVAYAMLAGWGVPAQRTVGMLTVAAALRLRGLIWPMPAVLALAFVSIVVLDPWALLQAGFWLSFMAVAILWSSSADATDSASAGIMGWRSFLRTQAVATVGLAPLSLLFFQQVSLLGLAANGVAIPWVTLLVTPVALLGMLGSELWWLAAWAIDALMALLRPMSSWAWASPSVAVAPVWAQGLGLLGGWLLIAPLPWRVRCMGLALLVPLFNPPMDRPGEGQVALLAADIGQGNAVLVQTAKHTLLYDTGPMIGRDSDAGERVLLPLLQALGQTELDVLMLSHRDSDHVGGAATLSRALRIDQVMSSLEAEHPLHALWTEKQIVHTACEKGQHWSWDGVDFRVLHPRPQDYERALQGRLKPNGLSCVLEIRTASQQRILLVGDIEREQELALVEAGVLAPGTAVLLAPHHGSRTSSTRAFLEVVQPRLVLVQAGYRNRYGHPAKDVLERYQTGHAHVLRSDRCGAMHWHSAQAALSATPWCERERRQRYWHAVMEGEPE